MGEENLPPRSEPNRLFVNDGGELRDQARTLGLAYDSAKAQTPVWWDFDNDGLLDLFHGATQRPDGLNPPTVFHQTDDGFEDVGSTTLAPELQSLTIKYGILSDLTGDGNLELILPTARLILDTSSTPFADITTSLLTNTNHFNARDAAAADFNNDLRPDLYLARGGANDNDRLLLNSDQGLINSSNEAGINNFSNAQSVVTGDLDNDMDVDVYIVRSAGSNLPNLLYENQGDGTFIAVPDAGGAAGSSIGDGDAVVTADYDKDGFLDLFVTNGAGASTDGPHQLFRNQGNNNNWLEIDLEGVESNRDGIGAQVFLTAGGVTQLREQSGGVHRWSQNHQRIHFGLADNTVVDLLEIRWPSGAVQQLENIAANQLLTITEEDNRLPPINGTDGNDSLLGTAAGDIINGLGGNDTIDGLGGRDTIAGGAQQDRLLGRGGNDSLNGGGGNDLIKGNEGSVTLTGGAGNDLLQGGPGTDSLTGAGGGDRFLFFNSTHGVDTITDFTPTEDSLEFVASNFGGGLVPGVLTENQFILGTAARDSTHRFIYDQSTGNLFFDVDGNGNSDRIWMATLSNQAAVNFDDIALV